MKAISKKQLDNLIPQAIETIKEVGITVDGKISGTYHGYFSSFGADMINTSVLAAAIFSEDKSGNKNNGTGPQEDRSKVPLAILKLLQKENSNNLFVTQARTLSGYLISLGKKTPAKTINDILAAAIALKIGLRTFKKI